MMPDDVAYECFAYVPDDDLRSPSLREIYSAMRAQGGRPDVRILIAELSRRGKVDAVAEEIDELTRYVPTWRNWRMFADKIRSAADLRRVELLAVDTIREAHDPQADSDEVITTAERGLAAIRDRRATGQVVGMDEAMMETATALAARCESGLPTGLSTPWPDVTAKTEFRPGELTIAAGRPGSGKTAAALNVVRYVAAILCKSVAFVSLEMSRLELCERLLSSATGINLKAIRAGKLDRNEQRRIVEAQAELAALPIMIEDSPRRSLAEITTTARRLKRQGKLDLLVIDYLALITPENSRDPRQEQVAKLARGLKCLARELHVPILCLAQLNREAEKTNDHRPKLSHLRESGAIEQDADVVLFVHREECFAPDEADVRGKAQIIVAKNRNGETGVIELAWLASTTSFGSLSREWKGLDE
jgi:replicative DNA helicase